jgi:hypothetical protein
MLPSPTPATRAGDAYLKEKKHTAKWQLILIYYPNYVINRM